MKVPNLLGCSYASFYMDGGEEKFTRSFPQHRPCKNSSFPLFVAREHGMKLGTGARDEIRHGGARMVCYDMLLMKLNFCGLKGKELSWFRSFSPIDDNAAR